MKTVSKIFTIEITNCDGKPNAWYANKIGKVYDAIKKQSDKRFHIKGILTVGEEHCIVIAEREKDIP